MNYTRFENPAAIYTSNMRAEDGDQKRTPWSFFCEGVLIPLGSLFAVFLVMLSLLLIIN